MRSNATTLTILLAALLVLPAQAGVEIVMKSKIDIPGARMKIMGRDLSRSEQRILVDDEATLKATVGANSTSWIDLQREVFFNETKRGCTVTTFAEMEERLEAMRGEASTVGFMGGRDDDGAQRDPDEFEVRLASRVGPPAIVAGLEGKSTVIEVEVVDKQSGDVVSKIDIDNVYSSSDELMLLQEFDRKMAERRLLRKGAAAAVDFESMRARMMGRPELKKALDEMRKAGVGKDQAVVRSVTRFTSTPPAAGDEGEAAPVEDEPKKRGRLAQRMMAKMKERRERQRESTRTEGAAPGQTRPMSFSSELQSFRGGVDVSLPQACVEAYGKKKAK